MRQTGRNIIGASGGPNKDKSTVVRNLERAQAKSDGKGYLKGRGGEG